VSRELERQDDGELSGEFAAPSEGASTRAPLAPSLDPAPTLAAPGLQSPASGTRDVGELLLALGVVAVGGLIVWQTTLIRLTPAYSKVGPRVIPYIVGGGLVVLGVMLAVAALTGRTTAGSAASEDAYPALPTDWRTVGLLTLPLIAYLVLMEPAGFIIASAVLFVGAAFAMGSRRLARDILIGVILATVLYIGFSRGLGLRLPAGVLAGIV
jgi:putative tricarboxylic transport membrane protein